MSYILYILHICTVCTVGFLQQLKFHAHPFKLSKAKRCQLCRSTKVCAGLHCDTCELDLCRACSRRCVLALSPCLLLCSVLYYTNMMCISFFSIFILRIHEHSTKQTHVYYNV